MDAATAQRIFDPSYTTKAHGRGLGLSAVLGIVGNHSGAVSIVSEVGAGTTIRVKFPETAPPEDMQAAQPPARSSDEKPMILIVDDEPLVRQVTEAVLRNAGYPTLAVADGMAASEAVEESPTRFGLALVDHTMPRMSGEETRKRLAELAPALPVVTMSGWHMGE